jgi:hypothetical protein
MESQLQFAMSEDCRMEIMGGEGGGNGRRWRWNARTGSQRPGGMDEGGVDGVDEVLPASRNASLVGPSCSTSRFFSWVRVGPMARRQSLAPATAHLPNQPGCGSCPLRTSLAPCWLPGGRGVSNSYERTLCERVAKSPGPTTPSFTWIRSRPMPVAGHAVSTAMAAQT